MKIQLDTTNKTIKVDETVNLKDLFDILEKMLPEGEWKSFKLETNITIQHWSAPIIIEERLWPRWNQPWYTVSDRTNYTGGPLHNTDTALSTAPRLLNQGVYNIEA